MVKLYVQLVMGTGKLKLVGHVLLILYLVFTIIVHLILTMATM